MIALALNLDLISPETSLLSEEDRKDLALFDKLTQVQAQSERILGVEREVVEAEKWNIDTTIQLLELSNLTSDIPFATRAEL